MASSRDSSSSDEDETSFNTSDGDKKNYNRHSNHQIQRLEAYFKECHHPDDSQRLKLGEELKLKPKQIKFWFQNKRTQAKTQSEKADNAALRTENMKIRRENEALQAALNTVTCPPCGGPRPGKGERTLYLQNLRTHNTYLREERDRLSSLVNKSEGHSRPSFNALAYHHGPSLYASASNNPHVTYGSSSNYRVEPSSLVKEPYSRERINIGQPPQPRNPIQLQRFQTLSQMEKVTMTEAMVTAMTEVITLIQTEESMWIQSSIDGRLVIDQKNYEKTFTNPSHFKSPSSRIESSKEVAVIPMDAKNLVNMLLDTEKWANLFSTIVSEAKTIHVLESMDPRRNFSKLRMCERLSLYSISGLPTTDFPGVVDTMDGRKRVMDLGERMLKNFAWILKMPEKSGFSQQTATNSSGVRISVRVNEEVGQPAGLIVCAGLSLCLPLAPLQVYSFLKNLEVRHQWDVLCQASPVTEVARFVTGTDNKNCVNILKPSSATENGALMIIQDSFIDALGGMVVYAPVDLRTAHAAFLGNVDPSSIPILPSGFVISRDGRPPSAAELDGGLDNCKTLLTVAFQILVTGPAMFEEDQMNEWTTKVHTLLSSTIRRVKGMLNCDDAQ
ncbi:hypothetical protein BRARA_J01818 [Brassica rapa]|uniref:Homeobox domain-containing protein n=1 Tax=Brassica campestris TaxID=3711 RepID=A0A397XQQ0_BRACM|nr:hypothetical protein BRARA_J01818 [Brassica rapa]